MFCLNIFYEFVLFCPIMAIYFCVCAILSYNGLFIFAFVILLCYCLIVLFYMVILICVPLVL
jgi:hypothetical protein